MSRYEQALLPWEDRAEFRTLHAAFHAEHQPKGATECSLVDTLAWSQWRRRRLLLGERSAHLASLQDRLHADHKTRETLARALIGNTSRAENDELSETLRSEADRDQPEVDDADDDERLTRKGIAILESGGSYEKALAAIREDTRGWWEDVLSDDLATHPDGQQVEGETYVPSTPTAGSLLKFLQEDVLPIPAKTRGQVARRPAIRLQAWGESLDPFRMERLLALDERLTRQFEKALSMLIRLQESRAAFSATRT